MLKREMELRGKNLDGLKTAITELTAQVRELTEALAGGKAAVRTALVFASAWTVLCGAIAGFFYWVNSLVRG